MIADDVITAVTEPTDWVNSIVCNVKETPNGGKKVRQCLNPKDLSKNISGEYYYTRAIHELLPPLNGKKFFSVVDTKKGYWHVELDHDSSLLCTFNTPFMATTGPKDYHFGSHCPKISSSVNLTKSTEASLT